MNKTDIVIDAGINISEVKGLDLVRKEISAAAHSAGQEGSRKYYESLLNSAKEFNKLLAGIDNGSLKEQLITARSARMQLNRVSRTSLSSEAYKELVNVEEALNARTNMLRAALRTGGGLESASVVSRKVRAQQLKQSFSAAVKNWQNISASIEDEGFSKKPLSEQLAILAVAEKARSKAYTAGVALDEFNAKYRPHLKKVITPEEAIASERDRQQLVSIGENAKKTAVNTGATAKSIGRFAGMLGTIYAGGRLGAGLADSILAVQEGYYKTDQKARYVRDFRNRLTKGTYDVAGGGFGALILGAVGSLVGPLGTVLGASLGAAVGRALGRFFGGQKTVRSEAADLSKQLALSTMRYRGLYGATAGRGGWQFAKAVEGTGLATAQDVETLASTAQGFQAAIAFGGVSDQQYLGLSMLPNYFAALAGGATPEEALAAYAQDIQGMSPGLAQYASKLAGVPDNLRALANNPTMLNRALTEGLGTAAELEGGLAPYVLPYAHGYYGEQLENMRRERDSWAKGARSDWKYDYDRSYEGYSYQYDDSTGEYIRYNAAKAKPYTSPTGLGPADMNGKDMVKRELNIYVGNQKTTIGHVYTDSEINDQISYAVGAM